MKGFLRQVYIYIVGMKGPVLIKKGWDVHITLPISLLSVPE